MLRTRVKGILMKWTRAVRLRLLTGFGLTLTALAGCQTYYGGMTVPSPHYLDHPPAYAPESPFYPYARELASMQAQSAQAEAGAPAGLPARVPAGGQ